MLYQYPFFIPPGQVISQPYLPINFINTHSGDSFQWYCLVDTGADSCLIPNDIVQITNHDNGADNVESKIVYGISGIDEKTWLHTFKIQLISPSGDQVIWESKEQLMECVGHDRMPPLLGTADFLINFVIKLDYKNNVIEVEI